MWNRKSDAMFYLYVYSKQPTFGLTQEWLREVWSPRQGICLFTPCVGSFTSPGKIYFFEIVLLLLV